MRRRQQRHPALETAVFAAALLLSVFIARELWLRRSPAQAGRTADPAAHEIEPVAVKHSFPSQYQGKPAGRTERAVTGVAPIKLSGVRRRKSKTEAVPAPK